MTTDIDKYILIKDDKNIIFDGKDEEIIILSNYLYNYFPTLVNCMSPKKIKYSKQILRKLNSSTNDNKIIVDIETDGKTKIIQISYNIIDKKALYLVYLLVFNDNSFILLQVEKVCNKKLLYLITYLIKIAIVIYILLLPFINFFYILIINYIYKYNYNYNIYKQYYEICINPCIIPLYECSLFSGMYTAKKININLYHKFQNKLFWNDLFIKNNINTPFIIGKIINKKIILDYPIDSNKKYIIKPIIGCLGKGIKDYNDSIISNINNNNYIIQEKIIQTKIKNYLRITTLFNHKNNTYKLLNSHLCFNKDKGDECYLVNIKNNYIRNMRNNNIEKLDLFFSENIIKQIIEDAIILHKKLPNYVITVGWDIIVENNNYYFLEGNIPQAIVFTGDKYYYEKSLIINKLINDIIF